MLHTHTSLNASLHQLIEDHANFAIQDEQSEATPLVSSTTTVPKPTEPGQASCLYALITNKRSVSRRNQVTWYLRLLNRQVKCDTDGNFDTKSTKTLRSRATTLSGNKLTRAVDTLEQRQTDQSPMTAENPADEDEDITIISLTTKPSKDESARNDSSLAGSHNDTSRNSNQASNAQRISNGPVHRFLVTPTTRVLYLSQSIATSIVLDLSPSIVSVKTRDNCVFLDLLFESLKRTLYLLIKAQEVPSSIDGARKRVLVPKVFVSVIAYTPFIVAKNNQVLVQNRQISSANIEQVLVELYLCLQCLTQETHELVSNTACGITNTDYVNTQHLGLRQTNGLDSSGNIFLFPTLDPNSSNNFMSTAHSNGINSNILRNSGAVLEDILALGLFACGLMPRLSRLSTIVITDGLLASSNTLNTFRLKSISVSFVSLGSKSCHADACFGYTSYNDLLHFIVKATQGVYLSYDDLVQATNAASQHVIPLMNNPLHRLFCWRIHSEPVGEHFDDAAISSLISRPSSRQQQLEAPKTTTPASSSWSNSHQPSIEISNEHIARYFGVDQSTQCWPQSEQQYHDWRSFKQLERSLDADFEQVLSCLLREGYLIKSISLRQKDSSRIVARLVLHWRHNLDLEQELSAPYWSTAAAATNVDDDAQDPANNVVGADVLMMPSNTFNNMPVYGDTHCELSVHGSYSFLHNLYCDRYSQIAASSGGASAGGQNAGSAPRRRSEFRDLAYKQFRQLIDGVLQTHDRLQYLSRFYRDTSLSKVPSYLLHGNSLLYEQPHTKRLTSTIENVADETKTNEFLEYWQKMSCIDTKSWKNLMHIHTLRFVLEHDQPKFKNIHNQNASGRYTHVQCRRALSAVANFIKNYASFALLEDTTYIKFIYNDNDNDLRQIETSATKGFIVIRIIKCLPLLVMHLMFTSGIFDTHRVQIVAHIEEELTKCKFRNYRQNSSTSSLPPTPLELAQLNPNNVLKMKSLAQSGDSCCTLIRSPLERMLRVYQRNYIAEHLMHNWSHGLPGSCPITNSIVANGTIALRHPQHLKITQNGTSDPGDEMSGHHAHAHQHHHHHHHGHHHHNHHAHTHHHHSHHHHGHNHHSSHAHNGTGASQSHSVHIPDFNDPWASRSNLIFGKYLYGVRVVHTISKVPQDLVSLLAANALSKIAAIQVNLRINQGFHIAFNNSGIMNLVVELKMHDHSQGLHARSPPPTDSHHGEAFYIPDNSATLSEITNSNCLCQYIVFPPAVSSYYTSAQSMQSILGLPASVSAATTDHNKQLGSAADNKQQATNGHSDAISSSIDMSSGHNDALGSNSIASAAAQFTGEVRVIKEYWVEQQYGISVEDDRYHRSLSDMRYSQIVDHLYLTDTCIFECLFTYELLQMLCDKLSPYQDLDAALIAQANDASARTTQSAAHGASTTIFSPTMSVNSSSLHLDAHMTESHHEAATTTMPQACSTPMPSTLIEGNTRDGNPRIPLLELDYRFSLTKFFDYCQLASLNVCLFKDMSEFYDPQSAKSCTTPCQPIVETPSTRQPRANQLHRKLSVDVNRMHNMDNLDAVGQHELNHLTHSNAASPMYTTPAASSSSSQVYQNSVHTASASMGTGGTKQREHRSSYQNDDGYRPHQHSHLHNGSCDYGMPNGSSGASAFSSYQNYVRSIVHGHSLNLMFLETLHKRLKQMHDKELRITDSDRVNLPTYLKRRILASRVDDELDDDEDEDDDDDDDEADEDEGLVVEDNDEIASNASEEDVFLSHKRSSTLRRSNKKGKDKVSCSSPASDAPKRASPSIDKTARSKTAANKAKAVTQMDWRCLLRKGNQDNLMIVLVPVGLADIDTWDAYVNGSFTKRPKSLAGEHALEAEAGRVCPIFVFRCSSVMLNDHILSMLKLDTRASHEKRSMLDADLQLHFGQPCRFMGEHKAFNDELSADIMQLARLEPTHNTDERRFEIVHFRAFLRKLKNTVLKSRFSSLNDAYLSEVFLHKHDILYYMNNVDVDTQRKYHVSQHIKDLVDFIKTYEDYVDALPKEPTRPCNDLLNSILLQKCGLFINQPIARYDESNPLMQKLGDRKLLHFMRCNYKIDLPIVEDTISNSQVLSAFVSHSPTNNSGQLASAAVSETMSAAISPSSARQANVTQVNRANNINGPASPFMSSGNDVSSANQQNTHQQQCTYSSSVGKSAEGSMRYAHLMRSGGSPAVTLNQPVKSQSKIAASPEQRSFMMLQPHMQPCTGQHPLMRSANDNLILEAFRGSKGCSMHEVVQGASSEDLVDDISWRHEAHMAEVLRRTSARKESHQYRRVLKSKTNYSQPHSAIDQALKRVDSLGRLEHFCLTPLLFSASWRRKLAPVRDHTIHGTRTGQQARSRDDKGNYEDELEDEHANNSEDNQRHDNVCAHYIKEYEQYIQTLGFNSVQIKTSGATRTGKSTEANQKSVLDQRDTSYLIKFLNSGCLVFKVGFCKPYVYSILYSIEGERFNNANVKMNMTTFLDELDNIKLTMHLHSFTYDYHLRTTNTYLAGRQMIFAPGYHLVSFLDDFRKYYQKAPNYARNHILSGDISVTSIKVDGRQLYEYIVSHNTSYNLGVLEMACASAMADARTRRFLADAYAHASEQPAEVLSTGDKEQKLDWVLIELKREKIRYRDGKDPDIFDCGLLIANDRQQQREAGKTLTLKYFLILTNLRDFYPKLIHTYTSSISDDSHRPIRLGLSQLHANTPALSREEPENADQQQARTVAQDRTICDEEITYLGYFSSDELDMLKFLTERTQNLRLHIDKIVRQAEVHFRRDHLWKKLMCSQSELAGGVTNPSSPASLITPVNSFTSSTTTSGSASNSTTPAAAASNSSCNLSQSAQNLPQQQDHCDAPLTNEELIQLLAIVDSMDLASLDSQLAMFSSMNINWYLQLVRTFEDLKQSASAAWRRRIYVTRIDNATTVATGPSMNGKTLLLFIDPACTSAFVLLSVDAERGNSEINLLFRDRHECALNVAGKTLAGAGNGVVAAAAASDSSSSTTTTSNNNHTGGCDGGNGFAQTLELGPECRALINDFVNFCATFMWSTLLP